MFKRIALITMISSVFAGCASVPMESKDVSSKAKSFSSPPEGKSGLYIYRNSSVGGALKKDVLVDGKCVGETAPDVFFYEAVSGNEDHNISTESEFSPNDLLLKAESGKNYFVRQYIKLGVFVGGANLEMVPEEQGKKDISKLEMAATGTCSK